LQRLLKVHFVLSEPDTFAALARVGGRLAARQAVFCLACRRRLELMPKIEICTNPWRGL
jgi:hypothetical protein